MKVPQNLQYALTRNNNRYLVKNLNRQTFTRDPSNVFGRNTAMDIGQLRKRRMFFEANKDNTSLVVVSQRRQGKVTKRRKKRSGLNAKVTVTARREAKSLGDLGGKVCRMGLWKLNRLRRAQRKAKQMAELEDK